MSLRKPAAIHARWNKDLTITLYAGGEKLFRTRKNSSSAEESVAAYLDGWFGEHPHRVRWTFG